VEIGAVEVCIDGVDKILPIDEEDLEKENEKEAIKIFQNSKETKPRFLNIPKKSKVSSEFSCLATRRQDFILADMDLQKEKHVE
jgi:hypothetical protein